MKGSMLSGVMFVSLVVLAVSCASWRPMVDMKGVDSAKYEADLADCQRYAEGKSPAQDAATGAVIGGALGAATGVATSAIMGGSVGRSTAAGAAGGAILGGAAGTYSGVQSQKDVIRNCMRGRGYSVLD